MDINLLTSLIMIFIPLLFSGFLFLSKIKLALVNKVVLNYGFLTVAALCFLWFLYLLIFFNLNDYSILTSFELFNFENINLTFGINIDKSNILFLVFTSFSFVLISLFCAKFFKLKKQFLFTKQRFYTFLSLLMFALFGFFVSSNLIQLFVFWVVSGFVVYLFSFFDISKLNVNYNINRFQRITLVGDFAFLASLLLLFKYVILSDGYIRFNNIDFSEFDLFLSYLFGICSNFEFKLIVVLFLTAVFSKTLIFPFSCYYSFLVNSSNVVFLPVFALSNSLVGVFFFLKILPVTDFICRYGEIILSISILSILLSFIFILFEKNVKIIFGYLSVILNACFLIFIKDYDYSLYVYFTVQILFTLILINLFLKDKLNLKRRLINKQKGFYLEKLNIFVFENLPLKLAQIAIFTDKFVFQNILKLFLFLIDKILSLFVVKNIKNTRYRLIRKIFLIFALFIIFAIILILFGGSEFE